MQKEGRYEWDPEGGLDHEGENVWIPQDVCDAVDRLAVSMANGDYKDARILLAWYHADWFHEGREDANKEHRKAAEEENRWRAEHGQGNAEFRTRDGLVCVDKLRVPRWGYYDQIWKRPCRPLRWDVLSAKITEADMSKPVPIRTYEFRGQITQKGLPVYEEITE